MSAVGALTYLANATRPDIAFATGKLASFNGNPGTKHWKAVQHLFRYLRGTVDLKLTYQADKDALTSDIFTAYSDADHAGCLDTRKSTTGYALKMGTGAISWSSKKQTIVATSTTEAEYYAAVAVGQETLWMRQLLEELYIDVKGPTTIFMDNTSTMATLRNPEHFGKMKHVAVRHHWIRDEVQAKRLKVEHLPGADLPVDLLTKPLVRVTVEKHRRALGIM